MRFTTGLSCLAMAAAAFPVHAKEPLRLAPSSKWNLNYATDSCRMVRSFGTGKDEVLLVLDKFQPGPMLYMTLAGDPVKVRGERRMAVIRFGPNEREQRRPFDKATRGKGVPAVLIDGAVLVAGVDEIWEASLRWEVEPGEDGPPGTPLPDIDPARNALVNSLEIDIAGKATIRLDIGAMGKPMAALATCTDALLRDWGVDVAAHRALSRKAIPASNPGRWLNSGDYPSNMLMSGYQGLVHFRLIVDEAGKAKSCHIQQSTRPEEFEQAVCKGIMKRAQFQPALDAAGKPVISYYLNRVRFKM